MTLQGLAVMGCGVSTTRGDYVLGCEGPSPFCDFLLGHDVTVLHFVRDHDVTVTHCDVVLSHDITTLSCNSVPWCHVQRL